MRARERAGQRLRGRKMRTEGKKRVRETGDIGRERRQVRESIIKIARDDEERESEELNEIGREGGETEMHLGEKKVRLGGD